MNRPPHRPGVPSGSDGIAAHDAWGIGITVGLVIVAAGMLGIGRWLNSEEPTDFDFSDQALTV